MLYRETQGTEVNGATTTTEHFLHEWCGYACFVSSKNEQWLTHWSTPTIKITSVHIPFMQSKTEEHPYYLPLLRTIVHCQRLTIRGMHTAECGPPFTCISTKSLGKTYFFKIQPCVPHNILLNQCRAQHHRPTALPASTDLGFVDAAGSDSCHCNVKSIATFIRPRLRLLVSTAQKLLTLSYHL